MIRVLHAYKVFFPVHGGIPSVIAMSTRLSRAHFDTHVLVARQWKGASKIDFEGTSVETVASIGTIMSMPVAPTFPIALASKSKAFNIVVHHAPFPLTDLGVLLLPKSSVLIVHWHAEIVGRPIAMRFLAPLVRSTLKRADRIIVSDRMIVEKSPFLKEFEAKCVVVPYGCDFTYWAALTDVQQLAVEKLRREYPRLVVAVGRLVGYKGYEVFLRAMQQVHAQAVIIGDGHLRTDLSRLAEELGILGRVKFVGKLEDDDVKQYLHAAKVFAFPSITEAESFGIVQLEAMSAGKPVVNTDLETVVPIVVRHDREGLTVPPGEPAAFAKAVSMLLDQPDLAAKLGAAGRERVSSEFSQTMFLARIQKVYIEALQQRQSA